MEENTQQPAAQQQPAVQPLEQAPAAKPEKKGEEEFSIAWHLKVLAVIYVVLGIFYVILKLTLK
jgi:hypothetical protein